MDKKLKGEQERSTQLEQNKRYLPETDNNFLTHYIIFNYSK